MAGGICCFLRQTNITYYRQGVPVCMMPVAAYWYFNPCKEPYQIITDAGNVGGSDDMLAQSMNQSIHRVGSIQVRMSKRIEYM